MWLLWAIIVIYSGRLFRNDNRLYSAVGGVALSLMLAQLVAGIGSQHFYPEESTLGMWAAMLLALRVHVEEKRVQMMSLSVATMYEGPLVASEPDAVPVRAHGTIS